MCKFFASFDLFVLRHMTDFSYFLVAAAVGIPQSQVDEWLDLFDLLDRNGEGALNRADFVSFIVSG